MLIKQSIFFCIFMNTILKHRYEFVSMPFRKAFEQATTISRSEMSIWKCTFDYITLERHFWHHSLRKILILQGILIIMFLIAPLSRTCVFIQPIHGQIFDLMILERLYNRRYKYTYNIIWYMYIIYNSGTQMVSRNSKSSE